MAIILKHDYTKFLIEKKEYTKVFLICVFLRHNLSSLENCQSHFTLCYYRSEI